MTESWSCRSRLAAMRRRRDSDALIDAQIGAFHDAERDCDRSIGLLILVQLVAMYRLSCRMFVVVVVVERLRGGDLKLPPGRKEM